MSTHRNHNPKLVFVIQDIPWEADDKARTLLIAFHERGLWASDSFF